MPRQTVSENSDDPTAIPGQEHKAQVGAARNRIGVGQPGDAVLATEQALHDQRQAEGEKQTVEVVEVVEARDEQALDQHAEEADDDRGQNKRTPIRDAEHR